MKSTKKIFVVALAALMLVAFTACQANTIPTQVRAITGITGPDYLVGQTFDAKDFTVSVEYTDGTSAELNGSGIVALADGETFPTSADTYDVVASIGNASTGNYSLTATATAKGTFYVYDVTSIDITTAPTTVTFEEGKTLTDADLAGIVVTATYGKSKTVELDASEYTLKQVGSTADSKVVPAYASLADDDYKTTVTVEAKVGTTQAKDTYEITVTEAAPAPGEVFDASKIASITLGYVDEDGVFQAKAPTVYYGDSTDVFAVQATDENSNTQVLASGYTLQVENGNLETLSATDVVAILDANPTIKSTALEVTPKNYIVSIAASMVEGQTIDNNTPTTDSSIASKVKVVATLAAEESSSKTKDLTSTEYTFNRAYFQEPTTSYTVIYTGTEENPAKQVANTTLTVTFTEV